MKIFFNLDTQKGRKLYEQKSEEFGEQNVLFLKRSQFYWFLHGLTRLIFLIIVNILIIMYLPVVYLNMYVFIGYILANLIVGYLFVFRVYVNYICDFSIATPTGLYYYDQRGILFNYSMEIPGLSIQALHVKKQTLFSTLFGVGDIHIILSNIDDNRGTIQEKEGLLVLKYIDNSSEILQKLCAIILKENSYDKHNGPAEEKMIEQK